MAEFIVHVTLQVAYEGTGVEAEDAIADSVVGALLDSVKHSTIDFITIEEMPEPPDADILPFKPRLVE